MKTPSLAMLHADIGQILAKDSDLRIALQACAEVIVQHGGVALARLWVVHDVISELEASAGLVMHHDDARAKVPIGQFSIGHVARTRKPLLTNAILDNPNLHDKEWSRREGMTAFAGLPLLVGSELEGLLAIFDKKPIAMAALDALTAVAGEIALLIKRNRADLAGPPGISAGSARGEHAVITTTLDGVILDWNSGAEKFFGYRHDEILGQSLACMVPDDRDDEHHDILSRAALGETVTRPETIRLRKGGRRLEVRLTASPLRNAAGKTLGVILVTDDIADFKRLEQRYNQAQKMEVFGQLAGGVAHDFNNLLTVILGYSEIVISRLKSNDSVRELLREIQKAGQRAETLTGQLMAFSRNKTLEPKVLDLNAAVSDTEKMLRRLIGEDILMTTIFAPALKPVKIDPGQLQQVILNLAVNARDAMPKGGRLTVETNNVTLDEAYAVTHLHVKPGDYVFLAISDTGVGMNAATKSRIFEPLFTTKGPGKGTGLGLTTVFSIINQNGGFIEVYSELGRGSTFKVFMPHALEPFPLHKSHPYLRITPSGNETVLLVEDEDSVRALAKHVLQNCGYTVIEAMDGTEAIQKAASHEGPIDLLVSDVVMPHLGGRPLAERLLALKPQAKVLFLSGYTNDAVLRHGVLETDYAFLQKPFSTGALAQKVRDVLDQPARCG
jgi:two-component system, cell cycle sensor histidine kinase and response regulator CckA